MTNKQKIKYLREEIREKERFISQTRDSLAKEIILRDAGFKDEYFDKEAKVRWITEAQAEVDAFEREISRLTKIIDEGVEDEE